LLPLHAVSKKRYCDWLIYAELSKSIINNTSFFWKKFVTRTNSKLFPDWHKQIWKVFKNIKFFLRLLCVNQEYNLIIFKNSKNDIFQSGTNLIQGFVLNISHGSKNHRNWQLFCSICCFRWIAPLHRVKPPTPLGETRLVTGFHRN